MSAISLATTLVLTSALQAGATGPATDVFCRGRGDHLVTSSVRIREADGSYTNRSESRRAPFDSAIRLKVAGTTGQALIPDVMLDDTDTPGWHDLKNLKATPSGYSGKVYFNWLYSPVFNYDRDTGVLRINGSASNFSGTCTRFDPRTSKVPIAPSRAAPRAVAPSSGYAAPRYPASSDPRAAARAMARQSQIPASGGNAALKADLAFRLFNASPSPITEFAMLGATGVPSSNWLKPGERVAPRAFRAMSFAVGRACSHRVRIAYADGQRLVRTIDFCGKDILYAGDQDVWAE